MTQVPQLPEPDGSLPPLCSPSSSPPRVTSTPARPAAAQGVAAVSLQVFPLEKPCQMYRNYGDYRSPTRTHEGEDIAALAPGPAWGVEGGHDVYAVLPGS